MGVGKHQNVRIVQNAWTTQCSLIKQYRYKYQLLVLSSYSE